jgi:hypothetical protein
MPPFQPICVRELEIVGLPLRGKTMHIGLSGAGLVQKEDAAELSVTLAPYEVSVL